MKAVNGFVSLSICFCSFLPGGQADHRNRNMLKGPLTLSLLYKASSERSDRWKQTNKKKRTSSFLETKLKSCVLKHIFQILIGGNISGNTVLEDDFTTLDSRKWLLHPGGTKMPVCGSTGDALVFIEKASTRYVVTTDIAVNEDSFLQIDFAASCSVTDSCYGKYSLSR